CSRARSRPRQQRGRRFTTAPGRNGAHGPMRRSRRGPEVAKQREREIPVTVTYLEMESRVVQPPPPTPLLKTALLRCENPPVHYYRYLYDAVGRPYYWIERRLW